MKVKDKERTDRIIEIYNDVSLNQRKFAELIGVSQQLVSAVLNYNKLKNIIQLINNLCF